MPISLGMLTDLMRTFFFCFVLYSPDGFPLPDLCCSCPIAVSDAKGVVATFGAERWGGGEFAPFWQYITH